MATAKKPRRVSTKQGSSSSFLNALNFVSVAQEKKGEHLQTHCKIENGFIVATDGIMSAGHKIEEDLTATPHTYKLIDALSKCSETMALTQLDDLRLSIKSDKFQVYIPCTPEPIPEVSPDLSCAIIDDRMKSAFSMVSPIVKDESTEMLKTSVLLRPRSVIATDAKIMIECWHGFDLPGSFILPKTFITAILQSPKQLAKFGCTANSVTVYFNDDSWIKTQVFENKYPDVDKVLNMKTNPWPVPVGFAKGLSIVGSFSDDKVIFFRMNQICSHADAEQGASFEVEGLPAGMAFSLDHLKFADGKMKDVDFTTHEHAAFFFGEGLRGAMIKIRV